MRNLRVVVACVLWAAFVTDNAACAADPPEAARHRETINAFWKYQPGDVPGAQAPAFDDSAWQPVGLPHSFSIPYFLSNDFYVGFGWYRKHLTLPDTIADKLISLEFDGAFLETEVYINGKQVGHHLGGYTGFSMDITQAARPGDNLIAVRVNNQWNPRVAPRAGEHVFSGGVYRDVRLVLTDPLHVAWYGTFVTTPDASKERATVAVKTEVVNNSPSAKQATVKQQILDPDGKPVAEFSDTRALAAGETVSFDMSSPPIQNPRLWHPDHPDRYTLQTTVLDGARVADLYTTPFGIRWFKWTADQGFFLNGEHLYLRGANVHQDQAGWGDAVTQADAVRDVQLMKDAGFNFIRGSHYPHAPAFVQACDRLGILFWSENAFWSTSAGKPEGYWNGSGYPTRPEDQADFDANVKTQLTEMIRIHRNSPSIIAWSMCNEPFFSAASAMPKVRQLLHDTVELAHQLDPTRPAALGGVQRPTNANRLDKIGDIAGYNGDGATIAAFQNPGVPNMVSEYNSDTTDRPGKYDPGWGDLRADNGQPVKPWRAGQAIWAGFDHGSIFGAKFGKMGIVDYFRIPKRGWFWYRNAYQNVPPPAWPEPGKPARLKLHADKTESLRTDGTDSAHLTITVLDSDGKPLSDSPPAELSIVKGPGEFPTGPSIKFENSSDIRIMDGQAAISFRSYYSGQTTLRATSPGLEPAEITLNFIGSVSFQEGKTQPVAPRPYVRFDRKTQQQEQLFGRSSPTFPSSSADGHPGSAADDGDAKTFWQPAESDNAPAWTVDLERFVSLSRVVVSSPQAQPNKLTVEISDDQSSWRTLAEFSGNPVGSFTLQALVNTSGRFVRLRFNRQPNTPAPQLVDVEIYGTLKLQ